MQYKAKDIGEEGLEVRQPVTAAWLAETCAGLEAELGPQGLTMTGRLSRSGADYLLRGSLKGSLIAPCARCLEPAAVPFDQELTVCFVERDEEPTDVEEVEELDSLEGTEVVAFADGVIDLGQELREEILLGIPPSPLCREDCAGLCPVCGANRNEAPCDCEEKQRVATSKFAALAKLKT